MALNPQTRFAPLNPRIPSTAPQLKGIVFDVDGTLCLPQHQMFTEMRTALEIPKSVDILHHVRSLPTPTERALAAQKIRTIEQNAMLSQEPQPGLVELMEFLRESGVRRGLCTRNFEAPVLHLLGNHLQGHIFVPIITRETPGLKPKPDPAGILHIADEWGLDDGGKGLIMVGDSIDDMTAGHMAGAMTVLLLNERNRRLMDHEHTDLWIERLDELIGILEDGRIAT
ncbi:HAD superfamily hydrolase [Aspergillus sp. HF37]|nr:HAD superfamily hydrolase [Aspergillus sp. HF37]